MLHVINILVHVVSGSIAIVIGFFTIAYNRRVSIHKKLGRYFIYFLSLVVSTGFIGFFFFRNEPFFLMLTLIASYVGFAGLRNIRLKQGRGTTIDVVTAAAVLIVSLIYVWSLSISTNSIVVTSTMVALVFVTTYDLVKCLFLHRYLKSVWLYEHIYKMLSAFSALLSAFAGNVLRDFQPYSQIGPSALGVVLIVYFMVRRARKSSNGLRPVISVTRMQY